jgi:DNA-binding MarR family transcriptional regulator
LSGSTNRVPRAPSSDATASEAETCFLLKQASDACIQALAEMVGEHDLQPIHLRVLMTAEGNEPLSQQELSRRSGIDPSTLVAVTDLLERRSLVARIRAQRDRRINEVRLTPTGKRRLAKLKAETHRQADRIFASLTSDQLAQLHRLLAKLATERQSWDDS